MEPTTGDRFCLECPARNPAGFQLVGDAFAAAWPDRLTRLLWDTRGAQTAQRLVLPATVRLGCWPPYGPALTPLERVWRDRKDVLAWRHWPTLDVPQDDLATLLQGYEAATRQALTGYSIAVRLCMHYIHSEVI